MSIESIVLILGLIVLPLIQQMLQAKRQRDARASAPPQPPQRARVPEAPVERGTFDEAIDETFEEMPEEAWREEALPEEARPEALAGLSEELAERGAPAMPRMPTPATRTLTPQRSAQRRIPAVDLRHRSDLRRAVVLTTILGRCRADESYEPPERR
jgi:hypothetical protein